jgi:hypothetical protein
MVFKFYKSWSAEFSKTLSTSTLLELFYYSTILNDLNANNRASVLMRSEVCPSKFTVTSFEFLDFQKPREFNSPNEGIPLPMIHHIQLVS